MDSRNQSKLQMVVEELKKAQKPIELVNIGTTKHPQYVHVSNDRIVAFVSDKQKQEDSAPNKTDAAKLEEILTLFELKDAFINAPAKPKVYKERTVLIEAVLQNNHSIVVALLDYGADPSIPDLEGNDAFMHAAKIGNKTILTELLTVIHPDNKQPDLRNKPISGQKTSNSEGRLLPPVKTEANKASPESTSETQTKKPIKQSGKTKSRVHLKSEVLFNKNNESKTAEEFLRKHYLELQRIQEQNEAKEVKEVKNPEKQKIPPLSELIPERNKNNPLLRFKALVNHLPETLSENNQVTEQSILAKRTIPTHKTYDKEFKDITAEIEDDKKYVMQNYNDFYLKHQDMSSSLFFAKISSNSFLQVQKRKAEEYFEKKYQHGLVLLEITHKDQLKNLARLCQEHNFEPILIKEGEQLSVYGCTSFGWKLGAPLANEQADFIFDNPQPDAIYVKNRLDAEFKRLQPNTPLVLPEVEEDLKKIIQKYHNPKLNENRQHEFKIETQIAIQDGQPLLPAYDQDKIKVKAALDLLKDYYEPESAPLPHFLHCGRMRRILTFHWNRHHCKAAQELYEALQKNPLQHVSDICSIHEAINKELARIRGLDHDPKDRNNLRNSSYTRRLYYILQILNETEASKQKDAAPEIYLDKLYEHYSRLKV